MVVAAGGGNPKSTAADLVELLRDRNIALISLVAAWILDGMDQNSTLLIVDNDRKRLEVAVRHLGHDPRADIRLDDGAKLFSRLQADTFDLVFADTWPGKFENLDDALRTLKAGGLYVVDDLLPQSSWPTDHAPKVPLFIANLASRDNMHVWAMGWSTGITVATKKA